MSKNKKFKYKPRRKAILSIQFWRNKEKVICSTLTVNSTKGKVFTDFGFTGPRILGIQMAEDPLLDMEDKKALCDFMESYINAIKKVEESKNE